MHLFGGQLPHHQTTAQRDQLMFEINPVHPIYQISYSRLETMSADRSSELLKSSNQLPNSSNQYMHDIKILTADSFYKRLRGWGGLGRIPENTWMWLTPCRSIHTMMMGESLTLVYLDRQNRLCEIVPEIRPWRFHLCRRADSVLESSRQDIETLAQLIPHLLQRVREVARTQTR